MIIHVDITVYGKVQGVGYRWWAKNTATFFHLKGFVKNNNDGSVYIEIEGYKENITAFVNACKQGPANANVVKMITREGNLKDFKIFEVLKD